MNVSDIELSKKSKIIEIGSEKKKLQPLKVGDISKKSQNVRQRNPDFAPKTVQIGRISANLEKVF